MLEPARVIGVKVGQDDPANVARLDAEPGQLRADLVVGLDPLTKGPDAGVPAREVGALRSARILAGVDDDHALGMLDREGVDG
jgi:hypothetical protein